MITATTWFHNFYRYTILTSFSTSTRDGRMGIALVSARDNRMRVALITDINYNCFQMSSCCCWSCSWAWTSMCAYCCLHLSLRPLLLDFWCWTCLFSILTLLLVHMVTLANDRDAHAYSCGCVCATYLVWDDDDTTTATTTATCMHTIVGYVCTLLCWKVTDNRRQIHQHSGSWRESTTCVAVFPGGLPKYHRSLGEMGFYLGKRTITLR